MTGLPVDGAAGAGGIFSTEAGRLRLGWRLLAFFLIATFVFLSAAWVMPPGILTASFCMLVASVTAGWLLLARDGLKPGALGLYLDRAVPAELAKGLGLGVAVGLAVVGAMALAGAVRWAPQDGTSLEWLRSGAGALLFLTIPAAAEEALLRGYPLQALAEAWGPITALLLTSVAFGALHLANPDVTALAVANIAVAGAFLGAVYLRTGSLWWATGAHLGWNWSLGYLADTPVSGLELMDAPFYEGVALGPTWLGGGPFGPEGSVVATAGVVAATLWCLRTRRMAPSAAARAHQPLIWRSGEGAAQRDPGSTTHTPAGGAAG